MTELELCSWLQAQTAHMAAAPADHHSKRNAMVPQSQRSTSAAQLEHRNIMAQVSQIEAAQNNGT